MANEKIRVLDNPIVRGCGQNYKNIARVFPFYTLPCHPKRFNTIPFITGRSITSFAMNFIDYTQVANIMPISNQEKRTTGFA